jgi:CO dehydrogenase maturation factor
MKIAVSGKGGVGKSTVAGTLARQFAAGGYRVIAVDADPDANLAQYIGVPREQLAKLIPLIEMDKLIEERTGAKKGQIGGLFKLNPKVDDLPDSLSIAHKGVRFLQLGHVKGGGTGCYCPENALLRSLMAHLLVYDKDVVILDMEAGVEHLSRGTARSVDLMLIVVEPAPASLQTARSIRDLAKDLDIGNVAVAGNRIRSDRDREIIERELPDFMIIGFIMYDPDIVDAEFRGLAPADTDSRLRCQIEKLYNAIRTTYGCSGK